jgi:putative ABC transport system substrate-binding protein
MRRRDFFGVLTGAAWVLPLGARAQQPISTRRIALLMSYREGDPEGEKRLAAFRQSFRGSGWIEGQNVRIDVRWLGGDPARANAHAKEVVEQLPDVIVVNGAPILEAIRRLTSTIPIVFVVVTNPIGAGFVQSLPRPGGNITGFSTFEPEIGGKWLEGLKEIAPNVLRVGVLFDPSAQGFSALWREIESLSSTFGIQAMAIHARDGAQIDSGVEAFAHGVNGGLIILPSPINSIERQRIIALAAKHRLPAMYPFAFHARSGGLIAYGFDAGDMFKRAGAYVARILSGEKPGDLPVQAPTKFELTVNLKSAKALGLDVPPTLLARADEVIE